MTAENQLTKKDVQSALLSALEPLGFSKKRGYGRYLISPLDDTFRILFDCGVSQRSGHILVNPIVGLDFFFFFGSKPLEISM